MHDCDYSSGCVDVYIWIGVTVLILIITFLFCCRVCRLLPLLCGNEIERLIRGSKDENAVASGTKNAGVNATVDANASESVAPTNTDLRIEVSSSNSPQPPPESQRKRQPHLALKLAARCTCAIALGYILAIIIVAIYVATTDPFPLVPASACQGTCQPSDAYCCTYNPPFSYQDVYFSTPDGTKLHGWWIPSTNGSNGNLLYNHGSGNNIAAMYRIQRYQVN